MKKIISIIVTVILILSFALPSFAQSAGSLSISAYDASSALVPVPSGNSGERVKVRIPLACEGAAVSNISIAPVISTQAEEFPFEVEKLDYTLYHQNAVQPNEIIEFEYDFLLRNTVLSGLYDVKFNVSYINSLGESKNTVISVYVKVKKGYTVPTPGTITADTPVLMLNGYTLSSEKIYAGEEFTLTVVIKNTSSRENAKNIQLKLTDNTGTIMPASGNSASAYISSLSRGESKKVSFSLQTSPDAEENKYSLNLVIGYQGSDSLTPATSNESMTVSILQKQRIKIDEPTVYDKAMEGTVTGISLAIYNMGKAPVYNCMVTLEGDGLSLVESYFGGTLAAGGTLRPDLEVLTSKAGLISGNITLTYEDAYGVQSSQSVPFEMRVEEEIKEAPIPNTNIGNNTKDDTGTSVWVWILIAVVAITAIIIIFTVKKRKKDIEDF